MDAHGAEKPRTFAEDFEACLGHGRRHFRSGMKTGNRLGEISVGGGLAVPEPAKEIAGQQQVPQHQPAPSELAGRVKTKSQNPPGFQDAMDLGQSTVQIRGIPQAVPDRHAVRTPLGERKGHHVADLKTGIGNSQPMQPLVRQVNHGLGHVQAKDFASGNEPGRGKGQISRTAGQINNPMLGCERAWTRAGGSRFQAMSIPTDTSE